ncbi:MAG TPA: asparagine synthase C-terminal domain-containing protein, partial [Actinomycetota bacterium]|nr:asparagine synthase C-terminal domain-containing protein [Actinomycetota bacterium]
YRRMPGSRRVVPALVGQLRRMRRLKQATQVMQVSDPARRYAGWLRIFTPELQEELLAADAADALRDHDPAADYPRHYAALNGSRAADHLNRLMYVDLKSWLPDAYMEKTDKATMACSLEARLPLLDHRLVELAFRIPGRSKIRGLSTKRIFKRAVAGVVPPAVLRKRKHGFSVPTDPWFRGELRTFALDVLLDERTKSRGYFDARVVERLWREHVSGRHVWDMQLWTLLNLELWHRFFIDGEAV